MFDELHRRRARHRGGQAIAHALGEHKAAILVNHGLLTVGRSVDEAVWWFITMERTLPGPAPRHGGRRRRGRSSTRPPPSPRSQVGSHLAGWLSFQPLYDWITALQPDLLEE